MVARPVFGARDVINLSNLRSRADYIFNNFHNYFAEQKFSLIFTILRDLIVITTVISCYMKCSYVNKCHKVTSDR